MRSRRCCRRDVPQSLGRWRFVLKPEITKGKCLPRGAVHKHLLDQKFIEYVERRRGSSIKSTTFSPFGRMVLPARLSASRPSPYKGRVQPMGDVAMDPEGNVMGLWRGKAPGTVPLLAVAAHLDTVFPAGTDVTVKRAGTRLSAPGIGDDTRGLRSPLPFCRLSAPL